MFRDDLNREKKAKGMEERVLKYKEIRNSCMRHGRDNNSYLPNSIDPYQKGRICCEGWCVLPMATVVLSECRKCLLVMYSAMEGNIG